MKRLFVLIVPALAAAVPFATAEARPTAADATRSVCHRTSSAKRPYVKVKVSARQLRAHTRHAADIVPAPHGACPRTVLGPAAGGTAFSISLVGEAESPAGDAVGTGTATVRARRGQGQVCFTLRAQNITLPAAGAHIHRGAAGESGPIVVQLRAPGAGGSASGCTAASRSLVAQLLGSPSRYYVNVHTTDFPAGAIRGQLTGTSAETLGVVKTVALSGANECNASGTCNLGDPDGTGTAALRIRAREGLLCFRLTVQNILLPAVGAHIHRGSSTAAGPIVVPLTSPGTSGVSAGCTAVAGTLLAEIVASPSSFYANVHTTDKPAGAVRGQLN